MNNFKLRRRMFSQGVVLFKFYVTQDGKKEEFSFEEGMKWSDFVSSKYNDGSFSISETKVIFKGGKISGESSTGTIVAEKNYTSEIKLVVFAYGSRALSSGSIVTGESYSKEYSFTNSVLKVGGSNAGKISIQGIDFGGYSKLCITAKLSRSDDVSAQTYYAGYGNTKSNADTQSNRVTKGISGTKTTLTFDIQNVSGQKYIYVVVSGSNTSADVYDIWLE